MSKRFSWENFSVPFIKSIVYSEKTKKANRPIFETDEKINLIPYISSICSRPDEHFVKRYHSEIIDNFVLDGVHLVNIIKALEKKKYSGARVGSIAEMTEQIKRFRLSTTVLTIILAELDKEGRKITSEDIDVSIFTFPKTLDLDGCISSDVPLHPYQADAVSALNEFFITKNSRAGILCMPTGSGKTRVASRFLIETAVAQGYQVIWLTHRSMLIDQAADALYNSASALLKGSYEKIGKSKDTFKMVCVSGIHATIKATEKDDDVMVCSVQSLVRNLPYLQAVVGEKVFIVVDEAHHTIAPSYRAIIREIYKLCSNVKLLGLTATPTRVSNIETKRLLNFFDRKIIYSISMSTLIAKGFLSDPKYEKINTQIEVSTNFTIDEQKYIQKYGELSPESANKIAELKERNTLIVDTYLKNKEKYGKTLIFALNHTHCVTLCDELKKRGVKCDYIYCAEKGNEEKILKFIKGEIDVLINIQILTEGSDIPDVQTVFLTRPTSSDVLLMQMIGRGMRGTQCGGTSNVNIVDFHDIWGSFASWLNPEHVINNLAVEKDEFYLEEATEPIPHSQEFDIQQNDNEKIDLDAVRYLMKNITVTYPHNAELSQYSTLPIGWYDVFDEEGNDCKVLVFESQLSGYINMWKQKNKTLDNKDFNGQKGLETYFNNFGLAPMANDIQLILDTYRITKEFPHLHHFRERKMIDASVIAEKFKENNAGVIDIKNKITEIYNEHQELIESIYGDIEEYQRAVIDFLYYPNGIKPLGSKIEEIEMKDLPYDRTPEYDLDELVSEVEAEMFDGAYGKLPPIRWTDKDISGYFGKYFYNNGAPYILINRLLNSKSVKREAVKYIIYHELLHRDYYNHDALFRSFEHKYPNWTELERFLDFTFPQMNIKYSM